MRVLKFGVWEMLVDEILTCQFYNEYEVSQTQLWRNFAKYCENMSTEEKYFFESFGIDPLKCEFVKKASFANGRVTFEGCYFFMGNFISSPSYRTIVTDLCKLIEFNPESARIHIGGFAFGFNSPQNLVYHAPPFIPEGFHCINFKCENMKWLLDEPFEYEDYSFSYINKSDKNKIFKDSSEESFKSFFAKNNIIARRLTVKEYKNYINEWFERFFSEHIEPYFVEQLRKKCHTGSGQLWNACMARMLDCLEGGKASKKFDEREKSDCVLVSTVDKVAFYISDAALLTSDMLNYLTDITLTSSDFSWIYAKTYDSKYGPYYWCSDKYF